MVKDNKTGLNNIAIGYTRDEPITVLEWIRFTGATVVFFGVVIRLAQLCVKYDIRL